MLEVRHLLKDLAAQIAPLSGGQHSPSGFDTGERAVPLQDLGGEPVVVQDLGFLALREIDRSQRMANLGPQVLRGLVREGQAEHVPRTNAGVDDGAAFG